MSSTKDKFFKPTKPASQHKASQTDDTARNIIEAEAARLEKLGARKIKKIETWWVMEAPTGQRFCVVRAKRVNFATEANVWK